MTRIIVGIFIICAGQEMGWMMGMIDGGMNDLFNQPPDPTMPYQVSILKWATGLIGVGLIGVSLVKHLKTLKSHKQV